jgi:hypothetical protein
VNARAPRALRATSACKPVSADTEPCDTNPWVGSTTPRRLLHASCCDPTCGSCERRAAPRHVLRQSRPRRRDQPGHQRRHGRHIGFGRGRWLNSDCPGALVCLSGLCHAQCAAAKDCPANQRCVQTASTPTCQLLSEAHCVHNSDCVVPLVCAPDLQCRNQCVTARDCITGELCVTGVCANPSEVNASGQLQGVPGG